MGTSLIHKHGHKKPAHLFGCRYLGSVAALDNCNLDAQANRSNNAIRLNIKDVLLFKDETELGVGEVFTSTLQPGSLCFEQVLSPKPTRSPNRTSINRDGNGRGARLQMQFGDNYDLIMDAFDWTKPDKIERPVIHVYATPTGARVLDIELPHDADGWEGFYRFSHQQAVCKVIRRA